MARRPAIAAQTPSTATAIPINHHRLALPMPTQPIFFSGGLPGGFRASGDSYRFCFRCFRGQLPIDWHMGGLLSRPAGTAGTPPALARPPRPFSIASTANSIPHSAAPVKPESPGAGCGNQLREPRRPAGRKALRPPTSDLRQRTTIIPLLHRRFYPEPSWRAGGSFPALRPQGPERHHPDLQQPASSKLVWLP